MIEPPEALAIARQMSEELKGKRIESGICGSAPHKFAFYSRPAEEYETLLKDKTIGDVTEHGSAILAFVEPDYIPPS